jgi:uncharacterized cupredoxin-like copper-binding protein
MEVDIWVYPPISEFKTNKKEPEEGEKVKLTATITNPSDEEINLTVVFYEGDTVLDTQIHNVSAGETLNATFEWKADKEGKYTFRVVFDGAENTEMELKVNVKAASPGPGLLLAFLAMTLAATVALVARRQR